MHSIDSGRPPGGDATADTIELVLQLDMVDLPTDVMSYGLSISYACRIIMIHTHRINALNRFTASIWRRGYGRYE